MDQTGFYRMEFDNDYSLDWFSQSNGLLDTSSVSDLEKLLLEAEDKNCGHYAAKKEVKIGHEQALTSDHDYSLPGKSSDDLKIQINDDLPSSNDISNNQFENQEDWVNEFLNPITPGGINSSMDTAEVLDNIPAQCTTTINDAGTEDFSARSPDSTNPSVSAKSRKRKASGTSSSACSTSSLGCTSKNAIAARENRLKKKKYVEDLENRNKQLEKENQLVLDQADKREERIRELEMRNVYLENVLRNQSTLSSLLGNFESVSEVRLSIASQGGRKKQRREHDGTTNEVIPMMSNGVCLHVDGQTASLELCSQCAVMAKDVFLQALMLKLLAASFYTLHNPPRRSSVPRVHVNLGCGLEMWVNSQALSPL